MNQSSAVQFPAQLFCKILKQKLTEVGITSKEVEMMGWIYVHPNEYDNLYGWEVAVKYVVVPIFHGDFINVVIKRIGLGSSTDYEINRKSAGELINNIVEHFKIKASE